MNLKNKIVAAALCALIAGIGIFGAPSNFANAQTGGAAVASMSIDQLQQLVFSLMRQIQQVIQMIAQLKPLETCGNGICRFGETAATCAADCGSTTCAKEGGVIDWRISPVKKCCSGLNEILDCASSPCSKSSNSICTYCGNGICGTGEGKTNCPTDCGDTATCTAEGKTNYFGAPTCCAGLTNISNASAVGGTCIATNNGAGICAKCGNGVCGIGENECNCPADCKVAAKCAAENALCGKFASMTATGAAQPSTCCTGLICKIGSDGLSGTCVADALNQTCAQFCAGRGYPRSQCNTYAISPEGLKNMCASGFTNSNYSASDCQVDKNIVGIGKACCCEKTATACATEGQTIYSDGLIKCCADLYADPGCTNCLADSWTCKKPICTPSCSGKTCGSDGCGGACGACTSSQTCNSGGQCIANATIPGTRVPIGYTGVTDCNILDGWTCDPAEPTTTLAVYFYDGAWAAGKTEIAKIAANTLREQAVADLCGGNANHGFSIATPAIIKDGRPHTIHIYGFSTDYAATKLLGTPTIQCISVSDAAKKANGAVCATAGECASGICKTPNYSWCAEPCPRYCSAS